MKNFVNLDVFEDENILQLTEKNIIRSKEKGICPQIPVKNIFPLEVAACRTCCCSPVNLAVVTNEMIHCFLDS